MFPFRFKCQVMNVYLDCLFIIATLKFQALSMLIKVGTLIVVKSFPPKGTTPTRLLSSAFVRNQERHHLSTSKGCIKPLSSTRLYYF